MTISGPDTPTLRDLQVWIAARIIDPSLIGPDAGDGPLRPPTSGDVSVRFHAYADGYPSCIREVLTETFPALTHLLGAQRTTDLTLRYLAARPPRSRNLNAVGHDLAEYLRSDPLATSLPFTPDLAQLEWQLAAAFHAEQLAPLDVAKLAGWTAADWQTAVLRFQPAVAVITSPWPLRALREAGATPLEEIDVDLTTGPEHLLVYRQGFAVRCDSISVAEAAALRMPQAGTSLGTVTAELAATQTDPAMLQQWFAGWMQRELIVDCLRR